MLLKDQGSDKKTRDDEEYVRAGKTTRQGFWREVENDDGNDGDSPEAVDFSAITKFVFVQVISRLRARFALSVKMIDRQFLNNGRLPLHKQGLVAYLFEYLDCFHETPEVLGKDWLLRSKAKNPERYFCSSRIKWAQILGVSHMHFISQCHFLRASHGDLRDSTGWWHGKSASRCVASG